MCDVFDRKAYGASFAMGWFRVSLPVVRHRDRPFSLRDLPAARKDCAAACQVHGFPPWSTCRAVCPIHLRIIERKELNGEKNRV